MNLRDLKYLIAVAEEKHFGRAAEKCFVSQPTLSMQLKKLEEELDFQLFERSNKSVYLTKGAQALVDQARKILVEADTLKIMAKQHNDPMAVELKLAAIPTIAPYWLPKVLPKLKKEMPKLQLQIQEQQTDVLLANIRSGEIDIGLLALPMATDGLVTITLFEEDFLVAMPKQHALTAKKQISLDELEDQNLLLLADGHCLRDQALSVCHHTQTANKNYEGTSLETLRYTVAMGDGITLMPEMAMRESDDLLVYRPFVDPQPQRAIGLVWRKSTPHTECFTKMASLMA